MTALGEAGLPDAHTPVAADPGRAETAGGGVETSGAPRRRRRSPVAVVLPPVALGVVFLGAWYFISYVVLDPRRQFLLEPPHRVWSVGFADGENRAELFSGLWSSTKVALIGLTISIVIGFVLAMVMSQARVVERAVFPYAVTLQAIPILAIVPMIRFWFGTGQTSRIIVAVVISLFPIIVNTLFGLSSADRSMHDLFTLHHADRPTRLRKLMFPHALPAIFVGLRIAAGLAVIGAIVGDFFFGRGEAGIGQLLQKYANRLQGEQLIAAVILSSALGVMVFLIFGWVRDRVTGRWADDVRP